MAKINGRWPWPHDVGLRGTYAEEVKALQKLEKNLDASPVPEAEPENLLTPRRGSEALRVGEPRRADDSEVLGAPLLHVTLRKILFRRRSRGWQSFDAAVAEDPLDEDVPEQRRDQMRTMLRREQAMLRLLERYNELAESVYSKLLSESKG